MDGDGELVAPCDYQICVLKRCLERGVKLHLLLITFDEGYIIAERFVQVTGYYFSLSVFKSVGRVVIVFRGC